MTTAAPPSLAGVIPPMVTPLRPDGALDVPAAERLAARLVDAGVGGLFVLGSSGEGPWLTPAERARVIGAAMGVCGGRVPVLVGVLEPSAARVVEAAQQAQDLGADAVVVTSPYYFEADDDVQHDHFATVAAALSVPVVLYNIPKFTHAVVAPATVEALSGVPSIVGIKDSAGDPEAFAAFLELKRRRPGFAVLQGAERQSLAALRAGADGLVPGLSNVAPELFVRLVACAAAGASHEAERLERVVVELWDLHTNGFWLECLKVAVAMQGYGSGRAVGRRPALSEPARRAIQRSLDRAQV